MSNAATTKKTINQVYSALESLSYVKAVKLCQNLPPNHRLGQALLAHACAKLYSQGRYKALETIHALLCSSGSTVRWPELEREIKYAALMERRNQTDGTSMFVGGGATGAGSPVKTPAPATKTVGGKKSKGKKIAAGVPTSNANKTLPVQTVVPEDWDWIDVLDDDPTIALADIPIPSSKTVYDPTEDLTIRHTLSASLKILRLPITAYQLNCTDEEQDVVWEHALAVWSWQGQMGDNEMNDEWLASMLPEAWKRLWDSRKTSDIDEVAKKVQILQNLERHDEAYTFLQQTLRQYPDDWDYWELFFSTGVEASAEKFLDEMIVEHPDLRGPILVKLRRQPSPHLLMQYGETFCERALCSHADIRTYLNNLKGNDMLLAWSTDMTKNALEADLSCKDAASRRLILQRIIFAVKVQFSLQTERDEKSISMLTDWETLVKHWTMYKDFEITLNMDQAQKEDRPPDELILLAVQMLLYSAPRSSLEDSTLLQRLVAAALLEAAIDYSPHNFKLKLAAIQIYSNGLHSTYRAWTLYQELFLKHIQHETCSHIILQQLISSALFDEAFLVCRSIQDFHIKSCRELQEGIHRAMEYHHVGKAHEFMKFHTSKLQNSLVLREAKGITLNLSPLLCNTRLAESDSSCDFTGELGKFHGITGGTSDMRRAADMISEVHNPTGSFDVLRVLHPSVNMDDYVDNRDTTIKTYDILGSIYGGDVAMDQSPELIWENTVRRSMQHALLIRAALCADGSKGLKKGKIVKCDPSQSRRCDSFRAKIRQALESQHKYLDKGCQSSLSAAIDLSRSILSMCGGSYDGDQSMDDIESREKSTLLYLEGSLNFLKTVPNQLGNDCGVESASLYLLDYFLQLFVLTRIATCVAETFGWGKKKRKTKPVSTILAEIARSLIAIADQLQTNIEKSLIGDVSRLDAEVIAQTFGLIDPRYVKQTLGHVNDSQAFTKKRLVSYLETIKHELSSFEDSE